MKIRSGFVSNSSASSFIIYGKDFNDKEGILNFLREKFPELEEKIDEFDEYESGECDFDDLIFRIEEELPKEYTDCIRCDFDYDYYIFGKVLCYYGEMEALNFEHMIKLYEEGKDIEKKLGLDGCKTYALTYMV